MMQATKQKKSPEVSGYSATKRVRYLGLFITILGIFGVVVFSMSLLLDQSSRDAAEDWIYLGVYALFAVMGYGILRRKKIALKVFEILAILNVIIATLSLLGSTILFPYMFVVLAAASLSSVFGLLLFVNMLLSLALPALCLVALIVLHPKPVQDLFE